MNLLDLFEARYKSIPAIAEIQTTVERNEPISRKFLDLSPREYNMVRRFLVSNFGDGDHFTHEESWEIPTDNMRFFVSLIKFDEQEAVEFGTPYEMEIWSVDAPSNPTLWAPDDRRTRLKKKAKKRK